MNQYKISSYDAAILVSDKNNAEFFDKIIAKNKKRNPKNVANWIIGELFALLNKNNLEIKSSPIKAEDLGELIDYIEDQTISGKIAKNVFEEMFKTKKKAKDIIEKQGLKQITDTGAIETLIDKVSGINVRLFILEIFAVKAPESTIEDRQRSRQYFHKQQDNPHSLALRL